MFAGTPKFVASQSEARIVLDTFELAASVRAVLCTLFPRTLQLGEISQQQYDKLVNIWEKQRNNYTSFKKACLVVEWIKESRILVRSMDFGERQNCVWSWASLYFG